MKYLVPQKKLGFRVYDNSYLQVLLHPHLCVFFFIFNSSRISPLHPNCFHFHFKESHFNLCTFLIPLHSFYFQSSPSLIPQVIQMLHQRFPSHHRGAKLLHLGSKLQITFASSHHSAQLLTRALQLATLGNQMIFFSSSIYKIIT